MGFLPPALPLDLEQQFEEYRATTSANVFPAWKNRLRGWSLYAAAAGSTLAFATAADADIIYRRVDFSISLLAFTAGGAAYLKGNSMGVVPGLPLVLKLRYGQSVGSSGTVFRRGTAKVQALPGISLLRAGRRLSAFSPSTRFGPMDTFNRGSGTVYQHIKSSRLTSKGMRIMTRTRNRGFFGNSDVDFAGFRFFAGTTPGGMAQFKYGWIRLHWNDLPVKPLFPAVLTAIDYAYNNTPDQPIHAAPIPEPGSGSLTLLAAGALGVLAWRRRRKPAGK